MAYVNVCVLRCLKEELAWDIDKWLQVISKNVNYNSYTFKKLKKKIVLNLTKILAIPFQLCLNTSEYNFVSSYNLWCE